MKAMGSSPYLAGPCPVFPEATMCVIFWNKRPFRPDGIPLVEGSCGGFTLLPCTGQWVMMDDGE